MAYFPAILQVLHQRLRGAGRRARGQWVPLGLLVELLVLSVGKSSPIIGAVPPDSTWLHSRAALPDTTRLRRLVQLSRYYGPLNPTRCIAFAQLGLPLARRLAQGETELGLLDNIAISYGRMGNPPQALRYCLRELNRARELHNLRYEIDALLGLANVQSAENNLTAAEESFQEALALAERAGPPRSLARVRNQLGNYYLGLERYTECERLMRAALPVFEELGLLYEQGDCLSSLAEAALGERRFAEALAYGNRAASLMRRKGDAYGLAWTLDVCSSAAAGMGNLTLARQHGHEALAQARRAGIPGTEADILASLVATYAKQRAYPDAFRLQGLLMTLKDSLFTQERATEMARLQTQYETEAKRQQIKTLQNRARIQALERDRDRVRLRWLAAAAGALLLVVALFAWLVRKLRRSGAALAASNKTKDQLMSIVGHDLRGPVAAFQHIAPILRHHAENPDPAEMRELAAEIEHGTTQLAGLLDNMLHWARAQMGQVMSHPTDTAGTDAVLTAVRLYRTTATVKHLTLRADFPTPPHSDDLRVWADVALLNTILRNLTSNAIKFTPEGGTVTVAARRLPAAPTTIEFSVTDTGIGMSADVIAALYEPVVTPTHGTAGEVGTGLGLAVCRQFIALLGGKLQVESCEGAGTKFWFALPTEKPETGQS